MSAEESYFDKVKDPLCKIVQEYAQQELEQLLKLQKLLLEMQEESEEAV